MGPYPERKPGERITFTPQPVIPALPLPPVVASAPGCLGLGLRAPPLGLHLLYHQGYPTRSLTGKIVDFWQSFYWAQVGRERGRRMMINTIRWPVRKGQVVQQGVLEEGHKNDRFHENPLELFAAAMCRSKHNGVNDPRYQQWRSDTLDCGEDSFFLSPTAIGVADGVGGWVRHGVDPSNVSNGLMHNASVLVHRERGRFWHPRDLLDYAYSKLWDDKKIKNGSSTAILASLNGPELTIANFGDSRLLVVTPDGKIKHFVQEMQVRFNAPLQLGFRAGRPTSYVVRQAECTKVSIEPNDIVIAGTDGIFDNLHPEEIAELIASESGLREGAHFTTNDLDDRRMALSRAAYRIFNESMHVAEMPISMGRRTPWWVHREEHEKGTPEKKCGKADDMTVVVAQAFTPEASAALRGKGASGPETDKIF